MLDLDDLAFVDLETTGLSPNDDRITEIGVVLAGATGTQEWTSLINPGERISEQSRLVCTLGINALREAPRFAQIAPELAKKLAGRLFIAHNARFDYGFLHFEFERVGIEFQPQVLCSVMLSRKLYPEHLGHNLDALMQRYGLSAEVRHRALPDARLLWQFWNVLRSEHSPERLTAIIRALLSGPVLPAHLDPSLIDRLPESPGVFVLHGEDDKVLHIGKAGNLKRHLQNYFRIDRVSKKALGISHNVSNISWQKTHGAIGAHLKCKALGEVFVPSHRSRKLRANYSWRFVPDIYPCIQVIRIADRDAHDDCYGMFDSVRKALNSLRSLATEKHLCQALLGLPENQAIPCSGCVVDQKINCSFKTSRLRHMTKVVAALAPLRVNAWPFDGPIGIRERSDLHILDNWRYLGTAQNEQEARLILETRREEFDESTFKFIAKTLSRLPKRRITRLTALEERRIESLREAD